MLTLLKTLLIFILKTFFMKLIPELLTKEVVMHIAEEVTSWTKTEKDDIVIKLAKGQEEKTEDE
jgi:hypothetical protein